ncbi:MAG: hypothetical protein ABIP03_10835 [Aquihabitans sp.]
MAIACRRLLVLTVRTVPMRSVAGLAAAAALPMVVTVAHGGTRLDVPLVVAGLLGAATLGYAIDDPARATVEASPTPLRVRRAWRLGVVLAVVVAGWVVTLGTGASSGYLPEAAALRARGAEALAAAGIALALAGMVQREMDLARVGFVALVGTVVGVLTVTVLAVRVDWLPAIGGTGSVVRWLWVGAMAWAVAGWASRDPAAR